MFIVQAARLYRLAAERGDSISMQRLASLLTSGRATASAPLSPRLNGAASPSQEDGRGGGLLNFKRESLRTSDADNEAHQWLLRAAKLGNAKAQVFASKRHSQSIERSKSDTSKIVFLSPIVFLLKNLLSAKRSLYVLSFRATLFYFCPMFSTARIGRAPPRRPHECSTGRRQQSGRLDASRRRARAREGAVQLGPHVRARARRRDEHGAGAIAHTRVCHVCALAHAMRVCIVRTWCRINLSRLWQSPIAHQYCSSTLNHWRTPVLHSSLCVVFFLLSFCPNALPFRQAAKWYLAAAEQGYAAAQYNLGLMKRQGRGVSQSDADANAWFRKAADQGHKHAAHKLGHTNMVFVKSIRQRVQIGGAQ